MTVLSMERTPRREGDKILIDSVAKEEFKINEFIGNFQMFTMEIQGIQNQLHQHKSELTELGDVEETEEIKNFKILLEKANALVKKEELISKIRKLEKKFVEKKEEIKPMNDIMRKLKQ